MYILLMFVKCFICRQPCRKTCRKKIKYTKTRQRFCVITQAHKCFHVDRFQDGVPILHVTKLCFQEKSAPSLPTGENIFFRRGCVYNFASYNKCFVFRTDRLSREIVQFVRVCPSRMEILTRLVEQSCRYYLFLIDPLLSLLFFQYLNSSSSFLN